jgi:hypothetical protein
MLVAAAVTAFGRDLGLVRFRLPQNHRQIPQTVFDGGIVRAALQFGVELGTGVRTYLPATAPYVLAAAILLNANSALIATLAGVSFGVGRALMPTLRYLNSDGDEWDIRMANRLPWLVPLSSALVVIAVCLLTVV